MTLTANRRRITRKMGFAGAQPILQPLSKIGKRFPIFIDEMRTRFLRRVRTFGCVFIPPPLAGEGGERSEPGGG